VYECGGAVRGLRSVDALVEGRATTRRHRKAFMMCVLTAIASALPDVPSWLWRGPDP
jgi:hypothetical protein